MPTLLDKLWSAHEIRAENGVSLMWVDRHLVHEGSHHAFAKLADRNLAVAQPALTFGVADHYAPTRRRDTIADPKVAVMLGRLERNCARHGIELFGLRDPRQGIVHVIGPEQGLTLPGLMINCGDSHTSTHGAFGALAFGIGATQVAHVLATQTLWQAKPRAMRIIFEGCAGPAVTAKDMALHWISQLGTGGAAGHAVEYAGDAIRALSMEARMTLCNLSIEGGARLGMIAPDDITFDYIKGRPATPAGANWDQAMAAWSGLHSDADARFDTEVRFHMDDVAPTLTWGTTPDQAIPIGAPLPDPSAFDGARATAIQDALDYMGLDSRASACRYAGGSGFSGLMHKRQDRRSAAGGIGIARASGAGAGAGVSRVDAGQTTGRG